MKVQATRLSGYVFGACGKCGLEERAILMFDDEEFGVECMECGDVQRVDEIEWVD